MDMLEASPSQALMLLIPLIMTVLVFALRGEPRPIVSTGLRAAFAGAALYIFILFFIVGFGPLFMVGFTGTLLLYLPICLATAAIFAVGSKMYQWLRSK